MTLDLYAWNTSNGRKISIMLEELDVDYRICLSCEDQQEIAEAK